MYSTENFAAAIDAATLNNLDTISKTVTQAWADGQLCDADAQALFERVQARRSRPAQLKTSRLLSGIRRYAITRSAEQKSPDRMASLERRRKLAASGHMPNVMAARFTTGELAVAKIISDEWLAHGVCDLSVNEIAARSGTCRATTKRAIWLLEMMDGLITVERRPRSGRKHLTNIMRVVRHDWIVWLTRGDRRSAAAAACKRAKPDFRTLQRIRKTPRGSIITPPRVQADKPLPKSLLRNPWQWPA